MTAVLVVCHANICRSPLIEHLLRVRLADPGRHVVTSAGVNAADGARIHPLVTEQLSAREVDPDPAWRSRLLRPAMVDDADLVLTATRDQLQTVLARSPRAFPRTFVIGHLAAMLGDQPPEGRGRDVAALTEHARAARARLPRRPDDAYDLADPVAGGPADFALCADRVDTFVDRLGRWLT